MKKKSPMKLRKQDRKKEIKLEKSCYPLELEKKKFISAKFYKGERRKEFE